VGGRFLLREQAASRNCAEFSPECAEAAISATAPLLTAAAQMFY
jgi:hypothetical protein